MSETDLQEVYRKRVLEHSRAPHNFGSLAQPTHFAEGFNPLCGDKVTIYINEDHDQIEAVGQVRRQLVIAQREAIADVDLLGAQEDRVALGQDA